MESSTEASQTAGISNPKPALGPKPLLTPKPFSLQKNTTIRSIHAPKTVTASSKTTPQQTEKKSEAVSVPRPSLPTPAQQPTTSDSSTSSASVLTKHQPQTIKETKARPHGGDTLDSSVGKSDPEPQSAPPKETPKSAPIQKDNVVQTNNKHQPQTIKETKARPHGGDTLDSSVGKSDPEPQSAPPKETPKSAPIQKDNVVQTNHKHQPQTIKETKARPHGGDTLDSSVGKSDPEPQSAPPKETPKSAPLQKDNVVKTNHKASTDIVTNLEQKDGKKKEDETQTSVVQKPEESGGDVSSTANQTYRRGSTRKRLSMELTSKFESGGLSLPPQPSITIPATGNKDDANKTSDPEQSQKTSAPSNSASDEGEVKEGYSGGGSIKRRISLLFDSSSRPEVTAKREEPEMINGTGGVKARIKNWATETSSETEMKPQVVPRTRPKSFEPATPPAAEKTPEMPSAEPPAAETSPSQAVDLPSKVSPAEQPTETPVETSTDAPPKVESSETPRETSGEHMQSISTEGDVSLRDHSPSASLTATDEGDSAASESAQHTLKRDSVKRRSVRFGVVESDDGGPPVILGSESDSSEEEGGEEKEKEEASEDEAEEDIPVSVPVYRRVGIVQKKDDEVHGQEAERLKHLEFEKKRRAEEIEEARLKLEEERKRKEEEEEKEKEKARQREEEERERERLKEEEMERWRKEEWERERLKEEEREREKLREEEMERERQMALMLQRQKEEEREGAKQKEEKIKQDQEEREKERLKEEERKEERLREERERQNLREEDKERAIHEHEEHRLERKLREKEMNEEKQREEDWEKEWVNKTRGAAVEEEEEREREKQLELMLQRQKEEDQERARQKEERLRQEERETERLREEAEERERLEEEQEKEEMERRRQIEIEKQREEERREEERMTEIDEERVEVERKMKEESERKQAEELEEKLRMEEEGGKTNREGESVVGEAEPNLISFDSEDVPPKSQSPLANTHEPTEGRVEVVYEDFSVRRPLIEVDFDDFSVKPKRWGSQAKRETSLVIQSGADDPVDKQEVELLVPLDIDPQENKVSERVEINPEEQLISMEVEEEQEEETKEDEVEEDDKKEAQVNNYCTNGEDKDTDALIDSEPDQQNEACEQTSESDSPKPDHIPEVSSEDVDTTDFHGVAELAPFPESLAPLLDTSAQRLKADLGKKRLRTRPSRSLRAGLSPRKSPDWRTCDSSVFLEGTEASSKQRESDSEEEQPKQKIICSPPPTSQRVPMFPGLSPAALIAQIKRRTSGGGPGGGEEIEEDEGREEKKSQNEEVAQSPSQLSRSPRSAAHLAGAARVLPPLSGTDGGAAACPPWLKELKSKKRLSQYDGEA